MLALLLLYSLVVVNKLIKMRCFAIEEAFEA
jgi:hypothetical protein